MIPTPKTNFGPVNFDPANVSYQPDKARYEQSLASKLRFAAIIYIVIVTLDLIYGIYDSIFWQNYHYGEHYWYDDIFSTHNLISRISAIIQALIWPLFILAFLLAIKPLKNLGKSSSGAIVYIVTGFMSIILCIFTICGTHPFVFLYDILGYDYSAVKDITSSYICYAYIPMFIGTILLSREVKGIGLSVVGAAIFLMMPLVWSLIVTPLTDSTNSILWPRLIGHFIATTSLILIIIGWFKGASALSRSAQQQPIAR